MKAAAPVPVWRLAAGMFAYLTVKLFVDVHTRGTALPAGELFELRGLYFGIAVLIVWMSAFAVSRLTPIRFVWAFIWGAGLLRLLGTFVEASMFEPVIDASAINQIGDGSGIIFADGRVTTLGHQRIWTYAPLQAFLAQLISTAITWWIAFGARADMPQKFTFRLKT